MPLNDHHRVAVRLPFAPQSPPVCLGIPVGLRSVGRLLDCMIFAIVVLVVFVCTSLHVTWDSRRESKLSHYVFTNFAIITQTHVSFIALLNSSAIAVLWRVRVRAYFSLSFSYLIPNDEFK